jgi:hypothetical protein
MSHGAKATDEPPPRQWQEKAWVLVNEAHDQLMNGKGVLNSMVRAYLIDRRINKETRIAAKLGTINSTELNESGFGYIKADTWFLVIPWFNGDELWKVELRDIRLNADPRYREFKDGSEGLYLAASLHRKRPTFLVEGEIDALTIAQEAGDLVNVVATGSVTKAKTGRWAMTLSRMPAVFLAQDNDEKGEKAAADWERILAHKSPIRYRPLAHDVNDMLTAGLDVRSWVLGALELAVWTCPTVRTPTRPSRSRTTSDNADKVATRPSSLRKPPNTWKKMTSRLSNFFAPSLAVQ